MFVTVNLDYAIYTDMFTLRGDIIANRCFLIGQPNQTNVHGLYKNLDVLAFPFRETIYAHQREMTLGLILKQFYKISVLAQPEFQEIPVEIVEAKKSDFISIDDQYTKPNVLYWMMRNNVLEGPFESMYNTTPERVQNAARLIEQKKLFVLNSKQSLNLCEKQILKTAV